MQHNTRAKDTRFAVIWLLIIAMAASLGVLLWQDTPAQGAAFATTRANAGPLRAEIPGPVKSKAVLLVYDPTGTTVLHRYVYGPKTEGKVLQLPKTMTPMGSGSGSTNQDPVKVVIEQHDRSLLGTLLWKWTIWTKWHWDNVGLDHYVHVDSVGHSFDTGGAWKYGGVKSKTLGHYEWCCNVNDSGYKHFEKAEFSGPAVGGTGGTYTAYQYPYNQLWSHSDGSWYWSTSR